jgi:hypothetical protein
MSMRATCAGNPRASHILVPVTDNIDNVWHKRPDGGARSWYCVVCGYVRKRVPWVLGDPYEREEATADLDPGGQN